MRAVNLMPGDRGGRASRSAGSSPSGAYLVLGALGVLVVFVSLWAVTNKQIDSRTTKLEKANAEAQVAERRAQASAPYQEFAELARNRNATVTSLSATRFDWSHGLREVARVVPDDVWLTAIDGSSGAGDAAPGPTSSAAPAPRFEMTGCTKSQANVARLMARLRAVDGVRSVELKTSVKPDEVSSEDCPANKPSDPVFTIVISFGVPGEPKASVDSTGQIPTSAPSAPASSSGTAPAPAPVTPSANPTTPPKG
ncbi:MAG: PilN domain-containing protein [Actinomycetota bacterium]|nr:PilN domain-containing protein [Actinomycetota bacterium]